MQSDIDALNFNLRQILEEVMYLHTWTKTRWTNTVIIAIAIALFCVILFIRQQKIMKMLRDLTPPKAEPPKEEDTAAKKTE